MVTLIRRKALSPDEAHAEGMYWKYSHFLSKDWVCPVNGNTYKPEKEDLLTIRMGQVTNGIWEGKEVHAMPCPCGGYHLWIKAYHDTHDHGWESGYSHVRKTQVEFYRKQ